MPETIPITTGTTLVVDPVCGMKVNPATTAFSTERAGHTWFFCGKGCLEKFRADAARYDGSGTSIQAPAASPTGKFTCPMHPEVVTDHQQP